MRRILIGLTATMALGGLVACQPPPPVPKFVVTAAGTAADADPGDGVCQTAVGAGACTLTAAVQEGNALGRADIEFPYSIDLGTPTSLTGTITGHLVIRGTGVPEGTVVDQTSADIDIAPGASLVLDTFGFGLSATIRVEGSLATTRSHLYGTVIVDPGGTASLLNTLLWQVGEATLLVNRGLVITRHASLVVINGAAPLIATDPGGSTSLGATWLARLGPAPLCTGPTASAGYNASTGADCGLVAAGDQPSSIEAASSRTFRPRSASEPQVDAIPPGTLGCGTIGALDVVGGPRAVDANGDGIAQCDIGPWELDPV